MHNIGRTLIDIYEHRARIYKMLNRVIILVLLQRCSGAFTGIPLDGNHLEFQPLILRWSHNFTDIRGCVWSYLGGIHITDFTFISYGTKEGLEITILGWELLDATNPCAGVILKKNCTIADAGRYEMRVVAESIFKSKIIDVEIINQNDRSVNILSGPIITELIPGRDDNTTVYLDSNGRCVVILNNKYPDDTCTTVHRIGRNHSEIICNRTIQLNMEDDVTQVKITVPLDVVDSEKFVFSVQKKGQAEIPEDERPSETGIITRVAIGVAVPLMIIIAIACVFVFLKKLRYKTKDLLQRSRGETGAKIRHSTDDKSTIDPKLVVQTSKSLAHEEDPEVGLLSSTEAISPEVDLDFNQGTATIRTKDHDFQVEQCDSLLVMNGPAGQKPDKRRSEDKQTSNSDHGKLKQQNSKNLDQEVNTGRLLTSTEERSHSHSLLVGNGRVRINHDKTRSDISVDNTHVMQIHCSPIEDCHEVDVGARSNLDVNKELNRESELISKIDAAMLQLQEARDVLVQPHISVQQQQGIHKATSNSTDTLNEDHRTSCSRKPIES